MNRVQSGLPRAIEVCVLVSLAFLVAAPAARGASATLGDSLVQTTAAEAGKLYIAPDSPAFTFLGVNPTTINRPTSSKGLAVTLANAIDSTGKVVQGFAIEFAPAFFPSGFHGDLDNYLGSAAVRALANTRVTLGSTKASGDSASTDVAIGFHTLFQDEGDPMRDSAYRAELGNLLLSTMPANPDDGSISEADRAMLRKRRSAYVSKHWNARRTSFAFVGGMRFVRSAINDSRGLGLSTWLVHSEGLQSWGQLLLHVQYDFRRKLGAVPEAKDITYGGRLNVGSPGLNGFLELAGKSDVTQRGGHGGKWTGGVEFKLTNGIWASTGIGSGIGSTEADHRVTLITNLRWALTGGPRFNPTE